MTTQPSSTKPNAIVSSWPWLLAALGAHTGWGIYPVLGRYLQTVSGLPSLSILVVGSTPMVLALFAYTVPRHGWRILLSRPLQIMALAAILRSITNITSMRFTLAIYVQLIGLMTPFIIALFNRLFLRDRMPRYTLPAMALSTVGAVLIVSAQVGPSGLALALTPSDWLGLGLALLSTFILAFYMYAVRQTATSTVPVDGTTVLVVQSVAIWAVSLVLSLLLREDWGQWLRIGRIDWAVELAHMLLVVIGANGLQIGALRHLGAPTVSTMMPWRLVSTLLLAWLLLGERLTSWWQVVGAVIVLVTITWYLATQRRGRRAAHQAIR